MIDVEALITAVPWPMPSGELGEHTRACHAALRDQAAEIERLQPFEARHPLEITVGWSQRAERAEAQVTRLRAAIETVLADEESRPGGWGPDVTMVAVLREALT